MLTPGAAVTTSRNDVDYVVTEYGIAWLRGLTLAERVQADRLLFGGGRTDRQDAGGEQGEDAWIHGVGRVKRGPGLPAPGV